MTRFLFEYPYDGDKFAFELDADNEADAKARLKAIGWAEYRGEIKFKARIPFTLRLFRKDSQ